MKIAQTAESIPSRRLAAGRLTGRSVGMSTLAMVLSTAHPAFAADAAEADVDEIIVTGQKQAMSLDKTAAVIVPITAEQMSETGTANVTDIARSVTGLQLTQVTTQVNLNIRGVGSTGFGSFEGAGVGFVQDGVALEGKLGLLDGFYDLERVEVLKGPQGTLYGLNSHAGVVSVISKRPQIGEYSGTVELEYGNYNAFLAQGNVNVALGEQAAIRISGKKRSHDPYYNGIYGDADDQAVRGQFLWDSGQFSVLLAGDYFRDDTAMTPDFLLPMGRLGVPNGDPFNQTYYSTDISDSRWKATHWGVRGEIKAGLGFANLTVTPAYRSVLRDNINYSSGNRGEGTIKGTQTSVEARLDGETGMVKWLAGGYLFWGERQTDSFFINPNGIGTTLTSWENTAVFTVNGSNVFTKNKSEAIFGQVTLAFADNLRFIGGLRYSHDTRSAGKGGPWTSFRVRNGNSNNIPAPAGFFADPFGPGYRLPQLLADFPGLTVQTTTFTPTSKSFSHVDFKAMAEFDLSPTTLLYAGISTGYKAGGINSGASAGVQQFFDQETLTAYEAGIRTRVGGLRAHLNAYYWDYTNHQESAAYTLPVGIVVLIQNLPKSKIYGADLELDWKVREDDRIGLSVSWLETDTGAFTIGPPNPPPPLPPSQWVETRGHAFPQAPRWTINANVEHIFHIGEFELAARVDGQYLSATNLEIRNTAATRRGAVFTGNAVLTLRPESKDWYAGLFVRNFTDELYVVGAARAPGPVDLFWGNANAPRTYGVRGGINF